MPWQLSSPVSLVIKSDKQVPSGKHRPPAISHTTPPPPSFLMPLGPELQGRGPARCRPCPCAQGALRETQVWPAVDCDVPITAWSPSQNWVSVPSTGTQSCPQRAAETGSCLRLLPFSGHSFAHLPRNVQHLFS